MKYCAVTVLGLKTEDIVETTVVLQRGGKAPGFRINEKKRCTDKDPSTIR